MALSLQGPGARRVGQRGDAGRVEARRGRRGHRRRAAGRGREREGDVGGAVAGRGRAAQDPAQGGRHRRGRRGDRRDRAGGARGGGARPAPPVRSVAANGNGRPAARRRRLRRRRRAAAPSTARLRAPPSARRRWPRAALPPTEVKGTGRGGRISKQDVDARARGARAPRRRAAETRGRPRRTAGARPRTPRRTPVASTARASAWCRCRRCAGRSPRRLVEAQHDRRDPHDLQRGRHDQACSRCASATRSASSSSTA